MKNADTGETEQYFIDSECARFRIAVTDKDTSSQMFIAWHLSRPPTFLGAFRTKAEAVAKCDECAKSLPPPRAAEEAA